MSVSFAPMANALLAAFGETVTYRPRAGSPRTMTAVVVRQPTDGLPADPRFVRPVYEIHIANNASTGALVTEIDTGGDTFAVAGREGGSAVEVAVNRIIEHDSGMIALEVR